MLSLGRKQLLAELTWSRLAGDIGELGRDLRDFDVLPKETLQTRLHALTQVFGFQVKSELSEVDEVCYSEASTKRRHDDPQRAEEPLTVGSSRTDGQKVNGEAV